MWFRQLATILALIASTSTASGSIRSFTSTGNPILADGSLYSADPGPIVVNDTLYVISGQDTAPVGDNEFIQNDWVLFSSANPNPAGAAWSVHVNFTQPHSLFSWAAEGTAYAAQIVQGTDKRFYLYAPVSQASYTTQDPFGIGVAVANNIQGPYKDAHPSGPIVSQSYPAPGNSIQNIDPTVYVDDDGTAYMYWGTFGQLMGVQLKSDMVTFATTPIQVTSLDGFFEASWLFKRNGTYYLAYADNAYGGGSKCTPAYYHACLAYGSAPSPLGPWTYQDIILPIVSSTTSHSGVIQFKDTWYLVYHTADASAGGNFRRSVAIDNLFWDDSVSPPLIKPVKQTFRPASPAQPTYNRGQLANASTVPECAGAYWIAALNDLDVPLNPLPPQYWSSYNGPSSVVTSVLTYRWNTTQELNGTSMVFFADHEAGAVEGVAPPTSWKVEYLKSDGKTWAAVKNRTSYPLDVTNTPKVVPFTTVNTKGLRATLKAPTNGTSTAGVAVSEWFVTATTAKKF